MYRKFCSVWVGGWVGGGVGIPGYGGTALGMHEIL